MKITVSKPPALNALYGTNKWGGKYLKAAGRVWKEEFLWKVSAMGEQNLYAVPCILYVVLYTAKHQDNDSILKLMQDCIQEAEVVKDDFWFFRIIVDKVRVHKVAEERVEIEVRVLSEEEVSGLGHFGAVEGA